MNDTSLQIAALIASRLCHDLISPVGAICNGLEVLRDEADAAMREHALSLIEVSARQATARLEFARMAFGVAAAAGADVELAEARRLIEGLLARGKIAVDWAMPERTEPKEHIKLMLNVAQLAADCIPRGGVLHVAEVEAGFRITATGAKAKLAPDVRLALFDKQDLTALDSRQVQPYYVQLLTAALGAALKIDEAEDRVQIAAHFLAAR